MIPELGTKRIDFENLSQENYDFLEARVLRKKCPDTEHNLQALIKRVDNKVIIENVCCERFAIIIGNSLSVRNINDFAVHFRGKILNTFSILELCVDGIIELCSIQFMNDFPNGIPEELSMREKKQFFKICLQRYETLSKMNTDKIWGNFCNVVEKRNHLAHWTVDTSSEALILLQRKMIRFVNTKRLKIISEDIFDGKTTSELVLKIERLTNELGCLYKFFKNFKNI